MLYSGFSVLPHSVFWSADFSGRLDNTDFIGLNELHSQNPTINVWDWTGRECDTYYHALEYDSASELTVPVLKGTYHAKILKVVNEGINPPVRNSE